MINPLILGVLLLSVSDAENVPSVFDLLLTLIQLNQIIISSSKREFKDPKIQ